MTTNATITPKKKPRTIRQMAKGYLWSCLWILLFLAISFAIMLGAAPWLSKIAQYDPSIVMTTGFVAIRVIAYYGAYRWIVARYLQTPDEIALFRKIVIPFFIACELLLGINLIGLLVELLS